MSEKIATLAGDGNRVHVLSIARNFKRSWLELAEALSEVYKKKSWKAWGFETFELYCQKELHLKKNTVSKLLGSFRFLNSAAPSVIERSRKEKDALVPSLQVVDFVAKATKRGAADKGTMAEITRAAFEEGVEAPKLARRYKEVAFPMSAGDRETQIRSQMTNTARKLANLISDSDAPIPHDIAIVVEEAIGQLLEVLDTAN